MMMLNALAQNEHTSGNQSNRRTSFLFTSICDNDFGESDMHAAYSISSPFASQWYLQSTRSVSASHSSLWSCPTFGIVSHEQSNRVASWCGSTKVHQSFESKRVTIFPSKWPDSLISQIIDLVSTARLWKILSRIVIFSSYCSGTDSRQLRYQSCLLNYSER